MGRTSIGVVRTAGCIRQKCRTGKPASCAYCRCMCAEEEAALEKRLILLNSFYLTTAVVVIPTIESIERSYQEHAAILQAIRKNELNTAVKCLRFHLENAGEELLKNMKKRDRKLS